jgi:hypothetical protein
MDVLALTTMKNAAKCDTSCELQYLVNHPNFERMLRCLGIPGSMFVGASAEQVLPGVVPWQCVELVLFSFSMPPAVVAG